MKSFLTFFISTILIVGSAHSSGFIADFWANGRLYRIKIFEHVHASLGTRRGAVMVISNPRMPERFRTLTSFQDGRGNFEDDLAKKNPKALALVGTPDLGTDKNPYPGQNLFSSNLSFRGVVDHERPTSRLRQDRHFIMHNVVLRDVAEVVFEPEFTYKEPVPHHARFPATLKIVLRSGLSMTIKDIVCSRYIKEENLRERRQEESSCETNSASSKE